MLRRAVILAVLILTGGIAGAHAQTSEDDAAFQRRVIAIFQSDPVARSEALDWFAARGEPDIAPTLIVAHRFVFDAADEFDRVLQQVTGHQASGWFEWMLWQEANPDLKPHQGYDRLRRYLFSSIDPRFDVFFDGHKTRPGNMRIRLEEIVWGGVGALDGIPSLDFPEMIPAVGAAYLKDDDLVFGVSINGDARAYPLRIMGWHEMFNDVIGGQPVALAYCTLCGSGILFDTSVEGQDKPFVFGSSGLLYRSNKLMYDQQTHSLWNQFTGEPVTGDLAFSGIRLKTLPVAITTWAAWVAANPETTVLSLNTGFRRDYGSGVVYRDYFASPDLMFPTRVKADAAPKSYVYGIREAGSARAWPLSAFEGGKLIHDRIGETPIILIGDSATRTVRAYESGGLTFERMAGGLTADGTAWAIHEDRLSGPDGSTLRRLPGHVAYRFAWDGYLGGVGTVYPDPAN